MVTHLDLIGQLPVCALSTSKIGDGFSEMSGDASSSPRASPFLKATSYLDRVNLKEVEVCFN